MTAITFSELREYDQRESNIASIVSRITHLGVVVLCSLSHIFPNSIKAARLAMLLDVRDWRKTLQPVLLRLELHGLATHTGSASSESWHCTDLGRIEALHLIAASTAASTVALPSATQPAQPAIIVDNFVDNLSGDNLLTPSSSSSDQIDQSVLDSDQIESEEEEAEFKKYLCRFYGFTGERAAAVIASDKIFSEDICAWMYQVAQMERNGFKFRKSAAAYALACLLKNDAPPDSAIEGSRYNLDQRWTLFCQEREAHEA